jgi:hypothetical protein
MYLHRCVREHVSTHGGQRLLSGVLLSHSLPYFWRLGSHCTWSWVTWPAWLAGRVRDSPVSAGEAAVPAFTWVLGNKCTPSCCAASTLATELSSKSAPQIDVIDLYVCVVSVCVVGTFACCGHTCARHVKAGLMSCNSPL